ncbi:hypothetical protein [Sodalis-like endosymbiont of Proechinophthirus fluctus]|uniref:hypothetical protein n=1 Tax=Sodalis-like endosymbiont of Proechinophthirus fluctus TaxID=1462730 RepID=UPI000A4B3AF8|nr:hypothetical protein [Sodalis-like endosymbiont of Proechinophthirus fluctus]
MQDLLKDAFSQFAVTMSVDYAALLGDSPQHATLKRWERIICGDEVTLERNLLLS